MVHPLRYTPFRAILAACLTLGLAASAAAQDSSAGQGGFRTLAPPVFQAAADSFDGVVPVQKDGLWGLMGGDGTFVVPPGYSDIGRPGKGRLPVMKDGMWGVIDAKGKVVTPFAFQEIGQIADWTPMRWKGQWWAVGPDGQPEGQPLPFDVLLGNDGTCMVGKKNGVPIAVNRGTPSAATMLDATDDMQPPSEGFVPITQNGKAGHLDCAYGIIVGGDAASDAVRGFHQGWAALKQNGLWGFGSIYAAGWEFGGQYSDAGDFAEGMAPVKDGSGKWGYVLPGGGMAIAPAFDAARSFASGMAAVQLQGKWGFIGTDGGWIIPPTFDAVANASGGVAAVKRGILWGVVAAPPMALLRARIAPLSQALGSLTTALRWTAAACPSDILPAGTDILTAPGGAVALTVTPGTVLGVCRIGHQAGFTQVSHAATSLGWVPDSALIPLR